MTTYSSISAFIEGQAALAVRSMLSLDRSLEETRGELASIREALQVSLEKERELISEVSAYEKSNVLLERQLRDVVALIKSRRYGIALECLEGTLSVLRATASPEAIEQVKRLQKAD